MSCNSAYYAAEKILLLAGPYKQIDSAIELCDHIRAPGERRVALIALAALIAQQPDSPFSERPLYDRLTQIQAVVIKMGPADQEQQYLELARVLLLRDRFLEAFLLVSPQNPVRSVFREVYLTTRPRTEESRDQFIACRIFDIAARKALEVPLGELTAASTDAMTLSTPERRIHALEALQRRPFAVEALLRCF